MHSLGGNSPMAYGSAGMDRKKCPPEANGWSHGPSECPYLSNWTSWK